jgi:hypothetical protein
MLGHRHAHAVQRGLSLGMLPLTAHRFFRLFRGSDAMTSRGHRPVSVDPAGFLAALTAVRRQNFSHNQGFHPEIRVETSANIVERLRRFNH